MSEKRRVVVTGLGVATPLGLGIEPFWDALLQDQSGIRRIESFDASGMEVQIGGELPTFKLADFIPKTYRKSVKVMSRDITIAVISAYHAVKDAGLATKCIVDRGEADGPADVDSTRFGANIGAGLISADLVELAGALNTAVDEQGQFSLKIWGATGMEELTPLWLLKFLPNMLACHVTIIHDAQGPSNTITCGEASSHLAIGEAFRTIARGDCDVCICGGAESKAHPMAMTRPQLWHRLDTQHNSDPARACRPFAADRAGGAAAEGGGLAILESYEHAKARGARIYAEVVGFGAATSIKCWNGADTSGQAISLAIRNAMRDANITPEQVDLAAPMGSGCVDFDEGEMAGFHDAIGDRLTEIPALSIRAAVGNNGAGSGALDFCAMVRSVHQGTVPPSRNTAGPDPASRFQFAGTDPVDARIGHAVGVGYAMSGGQTGAVVVKRYEE